MEGQTNLYSVQIEVRGENGTETLAGNLFVAPRGASKSTHLSLGFALYCIALDLKHYIVEVCDVYDQAVAVVLRDRKVSTSYIQRRLGIGYNRAASLIERMENEGVVSPANHAGKREVLVGAAP